MLICEVLRVFARILFLSLSLREFNFRKGHKVGKRGSFKQTISAGSGMTTATHLVYHHTFIHTCYIRLLFIRSPNHLTFSQCHQTPARPQQQSASACASARLLALGCVLQLRSSVFPARAWRRRAAAAWAGERTTTRPPRTAKALRVKEQQTRQRQMMSARLMMAWLYPRLQRRAVQQ